MSMSTGLTNYIVNTSLSLHDAAKLGHCIAVQASHLPVLSYPLAVTAVQRSGMSSRSAADGRNWSQLPLIATCIAYQLLPATQHSHTALFCVKGPSKIAPG